MAFEKFLERHVATVESLEKESALAYWHATLSGKRADFQRYSQLHLNLESVYMNRDEFEYVRSVRDSGEIMDPRLKRMADILYLRYLGNQADPVCIQRIISLGSTVENKFSTFRAVVDGQRLFFNDVLRILHDESDCSKRRRTWEASKEVGRIVLSDLMELIRLRNEVARQIGFENYYTMSLTLGEIEEGELERVFRELEEMTREPYRAMKEEIEETITRRYGITTDEIMPWHYSDPFLQEAQRFDDIDVDGFFRDRSVVEIARDFYEGVDLPVDDIIERSDLFEQEGKYPHAYCTDIDRQGDIRILANCKNNNHWMETMLHELGHGVYDKHIDRSLPFLLRKYPHLCATEASAMYFGRLAQDPFWMSAALGLGERQVRRLTPKIKKLLRQKQLVFSRWCQTMFHFERALYRDPEQDLNGLWWDIVERYQFAQRPSGRNEPDWATKIHIIASPVYYHNYMLGEMIASQIHSHVASCVLGCAPHNVEVYGSREVGTYFREIVYRPGNVLPWSKHIEQATGEPLTAGHFVRQFVKESD
ncbi:MAG: M2 family metallopeptidase [bacterium]|nr:MAG: M2 family metallopeptidase [bacterium]